jgi:hypothetical protein
MLTIHQLEKYLGRTRPLGPTLRSRGRMSVSGRNILDENGNPWIGRGYVYGQRELWQTGDSAADAAAGANFVRIMVRADGGWHGGNTYDGYVQDAAATDGSFGDMVPTYLADTKRHFLEAKAAGLKTILALDTNCGQNGNQGMPGDTTVYNFCSLFDGSVWQPGQNYFTALGKAQKVPGHVNRGKMLLRVLHGLVDFVEPLVEPNPVAIGLTQLDTNALVVQCMRSWLAEDPNLIFIVGGNAYQHSKILDPLTQNTTFPTNQIVLTADLLDNAMTTDDATWAAAIADFTGARSAANLPVLCQQAGTQFSSDADGSLLARRLDDFRTATGGSFSWTFWEKVSKNLGTYGPWCDQTLNASGRVVANGGAARRAVIEAAFTASRIYPT